MVVGYQQRYQENNTRNSKSGFKVGYVTHDNDDLTYVKDYDAPELVTKLAGSDYYPKPIGYMGVMERDNAHDLVILLPGYVFPQDDVLFVHELGNSENIVRRSWGTECEPLLDHPFYFCRILYTTPIDTKKNIGIVRKTRGTVGSSFVRYVVELNPTVLDSFVDYKMVLDASQLGPNIPTQCRLFHLDSGDFDGHGNNGFVAIWKEAPVHCVLEKYVLKITDIFPADPPGNCEDISFEHSLVEGFDRTHDITDLVEPMYIRYTAKQGGYFLSLFYHDGHDGISVHVKEFDF